MFAQDEYYNANLLYTSNKGWLPWSCDNVCKQYYNEMLEKKQLYDLEVKSHNSQLSNAKATVGILSDVGIEETREMFWKRFAQGKGFATRQTQWDAMFYGIRSMSRDENILSYIVKIFFSLIMNLTIGMIGTVIGFIFSLYNIIITYQANLIIATLFFIFASLAAVSFACTWLIGIYVAAAGTVYVGAKLIAANMRLENGNRNNRNGMNYRVR